LYSWSISKPAKEIQMTAIAAPEYIATPDIEAPHFAYTFDGHAMITVDVLANDGLHARVQRINGWELGDIWEVQSNHLYRAHYPQS
jgi:hypothetical protein